MEFPVRIEPTNTCLRCTNNYALKLDHCSHCHGLSDSQVYRLLEHKQEEAEGNRRLGYVFAVITVVVLVWMLSI